MRFFAARPASAAFRLPASAAFRLPTSAASLLMAPAVLLLMALPAYALHKPHHLTGHASIRHGSLHTRAAARAEHHSFVETMPSERATQIQSALIQHGYLTGQPSGTWDAQSIAAMQKLQADNGWQTRLTPDARALIKLGLGPNDTGAPEPAPSQQASSEPPTAQ